MHTPSTIGTEHTSHHDWIHSLIAAKSDALVSGHPSLSERMGLDPRHSVGLRFIADRRRAHCFIFTVRSRMENWDDVRTCMLAAASASDTLAAVRSLLGPRTFVLIFEPGDSEHFSVSSNLRKFHDISDRELQKILCRIYPGLAREVISPQPPHETVDDHFITWATAWLSRTAAVYELDALQIAPTPVLYALRRVPANVRAWRPVVADEPLYAAMLGLAGDHGLPLNVVAYSAGEDVDAAQLPVALHRLERTSRSIGAAPPGWIEGQLRTCEPESVLQPFPISAPDIVRYRTDRL